MKDDTDEIKLLSTSKTTILYWSEYRFMFYLFGVRGSTINKNKCWEMDVEFFPNYPYRTRNEYVAYQWFQYATDRARQQLMRLHRNLEFRSRHAIDDVTIKVGGFQLEPQQVAAVKILQRNPWSILADPMRTGKTLVICTLISLSRIKTAVIVGPASAVRAGGTWYEHLKRTTNHKIVPSATGEKMAETILAHSREDTVYLMTSALLRNPSVVEAIMGLTLSMLILDEIHLDFGKKYNISHKAALVIRDANPNLRYFISLSGTIYNSGRAVRPVSYMTLLDPVPYDDEFFDITNVFKRFGNQYESTKKLRYLPEIKNFLNDRILIFRKGFIRDLKDAVNIRITTPTEDQVLFEQQRRTFLELQRDTNSLSDTFSKEAQKLWHETAQGSLGHARIELILKTIAKLRKTHKKIIVFAWHVNIMEGICSRLGITPFMGKTKQKDRASLVKEFQEDPDVSVIVLQTRAGGTNLCLDQGECVLFAELYWMPSEITQAAFRQIPHKFKKKKDVFILVAHGIDIELIERLGAHEQDVFKFTGTDEIDV